MQKTLPPTAHPRAYFVAAIAVAVIALAVLLWVVFEGHLLPLGH